MCVCVGPSRLHNTFLLLHYLLSLCASVPSGELRECVWCMDKKKKKVKWDIYLLRRDAGMPCAGPANYSKEAAAGILAAGISASALIRHLLEGPKDLQVPSSSPPTILTRSLSKLASPNSVVKVIYELDGACYCAAERRIGRHSTINNVHG